MGTCMRKSEYNKDWLFRTYEYSDKALEIPEADLMDLEGFQEVTLPHDALIGNVSDFYKDCVIWYTRKFGIEKESDKRYVIYFEGAYMDMTLYVNHQIIGQGENGYTSCFFDLTDLIQGKDDEILVRIKYQNPNARWYAGPGINRKVWMYTLPATHIEIDSLAIDTQKQEQELESNFQGKWKLEASVEIASLLDGDDIRFQVYDSQGQVVDSHFKKVLSRSKVKGTSFFMSPQLWSPELPYLYQLKVTVLRGDKLIDETAIPFGFREVTIDPINGVLINGDTVKIKGVCLHSDSGALGSQFHKDIAYRQIKLMKDMGANAIRTAHNAVAPEFLELCDEWGMLVCNEIFDCWKNPKTKYDYARFFETEAMKDVASWVRRDRNHPCVLMWSVGNEIYDTHASSAGRDTMNKLVECVKENDPYHHAYITIGSNYIAWEPTQKCAEDLKLIGYNYSEKFYEEHHKEHPEWIIYGSETASCVQSRGVYHFPLEQSLLVDDDEQCSSLGNSSTSWGAKTLDCCLVTQRDVDFVIGQFLWSGIDYLGEPTPYHTKNSYFGLADTACFPKDAYFLFQSMWTSEKEAPMIHLLPYWDFNRGQKIDVRVVSNANRIELFRDNVSLGLKYIDHQHGSCFYADYQMEYTPGMLTAVAYDEDNNIIATDVQESFQDVEELSLSSDTFETQEGEDRIFFVTIAAVDAMGHKVRNANSRVRVAIDGPGKLVGLDNGDSTDYDSYQASSRRMFSGLLLAMVRTTGRAGKITVHAYFEKEDVPVRKVEIIAKDGTEFSRDKEVLTFEAVSYPLNANKHSIEWQITNDSAVPVKNAVLENISEDSRIISVRAQADGQVRLRALAKEENGKVIYISTLELKICDHGMLFLNPYDFISGSLFSKSHGEIGNGNEKGVSTSRHEMTWIAYENLDFGIYHSDQVTIPIFELDNEETKLIFWKGIPYAKDSRVCGQGIYNKPSKWNTYQEQTFALDEYMSGQETFGIELHHKVHIKGFSFNKENPGLDQISALKAVQIYGDSYQREEDAITGIGNNVSLVFGKLDFENKGIKHIILCGRTKQENNTIHILFEKEQEVTRQIIEFAYADEYEVRTFEIDQVQGCTKVTLLFLPGSKFDLKWLKFE